MQGNSSFLFVGQNIKYDPSNESKEMKESMKYLNIDRRTLVPVESTLSRSSVSDLKKARQFAWHNNNFN